MSLQAVVGDADAGARLDAFLVRRVDGLSRALVRRALEAGHVRVNDRAVYKGGLALTMGDRVELVERPRGSGFLPGPPDGSVPLAVVFEDDSLVVVDKAAGVPTHPLRPDEAATLANALLAQYPEMARVGYSPREPGIVHRLDNETSGLLIAARDTATFESLRDALREGRIEKRYEVLVEGALPDGLRVIDAPIGKHPRDARRVLSHPSPPVPAGARPARTRIVSSARVGSRFTRVTVSVSTATRHQIRAHFAGIGLPLVGDERYGGGHREALGRHFLHACSLAFDHPLTGARIELESPRPAELQRFLEEHGA